jgi:hypothetical protein
LFGVRSVAGAGAARAGARRPGAPLGAPRCGRLPLRAPGGSWPALRQGAGLRAKSLSPCPWCWACTRRTWSPSSAEPGTGRPDAGSSAGINKN